MGRPSRPWKREATLGIRYAGSPPDARGSSCPGNCVPSVPSYDASIHLSREKVKSLHPPVGRAQSREEWILPSQSASPAAGCALHQAITRRRYQSTHILELREWCPIFPPLASPSIRRRASTVHSSLLVWYWLISFQTAESGAAIRILAGTRVSGTPSRTSCCIILDTQ